MNVIKIDLDLKTKNKCIKHLKDRLIFLNKNLILTFDNIIKIELIKKKTYSCKIYTKKKLKDPLILILIQSILGDDWRRTTITLRDLLLGVENFNRLFDAKYNK